MSEREDIKNELSGYAYLLKNSKMVDTHEDPYKNGYVNGWLDARLEIGKWLQKLVDKLADPSPAKK